jgi:hypothetical protein
MSMHKLDVSREEGVNRYTALRQLSERFGDQITHLVSVWVHRLIPVCDEIRALAAGHRVLLADGTEGSLRTIPYPALSFDSATRLLERLNQDGGHDEGEEWERIVREFVGEDWFAELVNEGEEVYRLHLAIAESTRYQVLVNGFVALSGILEWWYRTAGAHLAGKQAPNNYHLTQPFAQALGVADLRQAGLPSFGIADAVRLVANDVKHHGGLANRSAAALRCHKGDPLPLDSADLHVWAEHLTSFVRELTDAVTHET